MHCSDSTRCVPRFLAVLVLGVLLAACETPPERNTFADITFSHQPPIRLDLAAVESKVAYDPPLTPPHAEHLMPKNLGAVAQRWADDRLKAEGSQGTLTYTVVEASVIAEELETQGGLTGFFTVDQAERYAAKVIVEMKMQRPDGTTGTATVQASRTTSVPEDATLNERERIWYQMIERLMRDMDGELEATVRRVFNAQVLG